MCSEGAQATNDRVGRRTTPSGCWGHDALEEPTGRSLSISARIFLWMRGPLSIPPGSTGPPGAIYSPRGRAYWIGDCLGSGRFGVTYDALGPFDQPYALKILTPANRPYHEVRDEWLKEAGRLYRLRHPNIVYVHDYFEQGGQFFLVLERCHHSLDAMLGQPFTERLVIEVARQLLFGVQYLSDNEIIHNDLHSGNILVVQGEPLVFKLSDLGIALELYGNRGVKPDIVQHRIMAPEVAAGGYTTRQSDLYQLGLLLFRMYTGQPAVDVSMGYDAIIDQIRTGMPRQRAETLGTPLGGIIAGMLRRHEQYRYASADQVWADLRRLDAWQRDLAEAMRGVFPGGEATR